ncbi:MAG: T9SS type A sorting domain-containing protein [Ginsengibacter sp.]
MKVKQYLGCLKKSVGIFILLIFIISLNADAQRATVAIPIGIGFQCDQALSARDSVKYFDYNSSSNILTHRLNCQPTLATPGFSSWLATISFNAYDGYLYFTQIALVGGQYNSYVYRWLPTTCPNLATLPVYQTFLNQFVAGVDFDPATGLGYQINFVGPGPYTMELQQVNFATGTLGVSQPVDFGVNTIAIQAGDIIMTPGGQLLGVMDNKYFTINWKDYGTAVPLKATLINTLNFGGSYLVGLAYSDGKLVGSISPRGTYCSSTYQELDILTGAQKPITYNGGASIFVSNDMTDISSGIGAAKKLVSVTENPVGSKTYDVVYEVVLKNYGGTPVSNVQAYDTLTKINGASNLISASITSITAPPGFTKNASFDGKTAGNFNLLTPGGILSNIPGQNKITLQITCKIANIQPGIIYYNQAIVTGIGLFGDALRDSSTNGSTPDLNSNDKPDDVGESQPTPLLISVVSVTPPCSSLTNVLYTQNFGSGTGLSTTLPVPVLGTGATVPFGSTDYAGSTTAPLATETYALTNNAINGDGTYFSSLTDHTGNANGQMLLVNADANNSVLYRGSFNASLCSNQQYSLSYYAAFPGNTAYQTKCNAFGGFIYPKILMRIRDGATGLIITEISTGDIINPGWQQYGLKFVSPGSYTSIIFELINNAAGGCGNDVALDDVQFGSCDALPVVNIGVPSGGCLGGSTTFTSSLSDPAALPGSKDYQWQVSTDNITWINIAGATSSSYIINPVTAVEAGKYYRLLVAASGNIGSSNCRYASPGVLLTAKTPSIAATGAKSGKNNVCPGNPVLLSVVGGTLGTNASWKWYTSSCGGTLVGTGASITVSPLVATTYYVRAEGDCNITVCQPVTIFISCDIDKDKDGIPDYVESNMPVALQDADGDGIINAFDTDYPGYVDNNGDFVNDNFQADGDSDGDGIPNYLDTDFPGRIDVNGDGVDDRFDKDLDGIINMLDLDSDNDGIPDVVEAGGVDTNGDGKLDNFVDSDNDGLSDQVDANLSGAYNSGVGLGLKDTDGDGIANEFDLDSDADGIPDVREVGGADVNNDGKIDGFVDANHDGISDNILLANALLKTGADINNDGRADSYPYKNMDKDKVPNPYDIDSDGDGIVDALEAGFADANFDGRADGTIGTNGWVTSVSSLGTLVLPNSDADPNPNYLDIDSDNDGIPDNIEGPSTFDYLLPSGLDTDGDGLDNSYDDKPTIWGGHGVYIIDTDADGIPDYLDLDTDGDGALDIREGHDYNFNGIADDLTTLLNTDADGDGLDDRFDTDNTSPKGTSAYLGNYGSFTGDPSPGTKAVVQRTPPTAGNRDWRWIPYVLPVRLISFTGMNISSVANLLQWNIISPEDINRFEIWRSADNVNFKRSAVISPKVSLNQSQQYSVKDDITEMNSPMIFYRLHIFGSKGNQFISNIVLIKSQDKLVIATLVPNPAAQSTTINMQSEREGAATIKLIDYTGKVVELFTQNLLKGANQIPLLNLYKYSNGVYSVQILIKEELINLKLVILR